MSMSVGSSDGDDAVMSDINTTPLVDVMLVLLIIFLITIPVITHTVPVKLPDVKNIPTRTKPENITVSVDTAGKVYWNQALVDDQAFLKRLRDIAPIQPQPEVHLRADRTAKFQYIGRVIVMCQRMGIQKIGFITEPQLGASAAAG
jgi:biopolymer transport protein ExbD